MGAVLPSTYTSPAIRKATNRGGIIKLNMGALLKGTGNNVVSFTPTDCLLNLVSSVHSAQP
jgi:hypothetical protein